MQREIKFRGFHKCENGNTIIIINGEPVRGKWVYGFLIQYENGWFICNFIGDAYQYEVDSSTVGQFTGLKDKNGREIYEGDIVKSIKRGFAFHQSVVVYNSGKGRYDVKAMGCLFSMTLDRCGDDIDISGSDYEVIGNIHDNPELLEEWR